MAVKHWQIFLGILSLLSSITTNIVESSVPAGALVATTDVHRTLRRDELSPIPAMSPLYGRRVMQEIPSAPRHTALQVRVPPRLGHGRQCLPGEMWIVRRCGGPDWLTNIIEDVCTNLRISVVRRLSYRCAERYVCVLDSVATEAYGRVVSRCRRDPNYERRQAELRARLRADRARQPLSGDVGDYGFRIEPARQPRRNEPSTSNPEARPDFYIRIVPRTHPLV